MRAKIWSGGSRVGRTAEEGGGEEGEKEFTILTCCPTDHPSSSFDDLSCESCDLANWLCEDEKGGREDAMRQFYHLQICGRAGITFLSE